MPPFPHLERLDCNCTGCRLLRAGVCIRCATAILANIDERDETDQIKAALCSGACREAVECYVASPPGGFDASRHKGPIFEQIRTLQALAAGFEASGLLANRELSRLALCETYHTT